jgi:lambda repressor-like predicted transcriptional regulator
MTVATERRLASAVVQLQHSIASRDALIVAMRSEGASLREIAVVAQLTPEGVRKVLARRGSA